MSETILDKAAEVTSGDRNEDYGDPWLNHECTADLMSTYLSRKHGGEIPLDAVDVCMFNILQKISRSAQCLTEDTLVDVAGYARNIEMILDKTVPDWRDDA